MRRLLICVAVCLVQACSAQSTDISAPASVVAGDEATLSTTGSGRASFYLLGPGISRKSDVALGQAIQLHAQDLRNAGAYLAILCSDTCHRATFYVNAAKPTSLTFVVHPSRVPVKLDNAVSGVAFPFDQFHNLALTPVTVDFQLTGGNALLFSRAVRAQDGIAWFRTTSGKSAGPLQVGAAIDGLSVRRVAQLVASDPCNLRTKGQRTVSQILVETAPVHDCTLNSVSDGSIVTFTATDVTGKTTLHP